MLTTIRIRRKSMALIEPCFFLGQDTSSEGFYPENHIRSIFVSRKEHVGTPRRGQELVQSHQWSLDDEMNAVAPSGVEDIDAMLASTTRISTVPLFNAMASFRAVICAKSKPR